MRRRVNWVGSLSLPGAAKRATSSSSWPAGIDPHLHPLSGAAVEELPGDRIGAQEGGRGDVADAQAGEKGVGGVAGAGDVAAEQVEVVLGERLDLRPQVGHRDAFGDDAPRQGGRVRDHRRDAERRGGEAGQAERDRRGERFRVASGEAGSVRRGVSPGELKRGQRFQFSAERGSLESVGARRVGLALGLIVAIGAPLESGLPGWPRRMVRGDAVGRRRGVYRPLPATFSPHSPYVCIFCSRALRPGGPGERRCFPGAGDLEAALQRAAARGRLAVQTGALGSNRRATADQTGPRSDRARHSSRPYGRIEQAARAPGPRPHGHLPDRRLHHA